jgi:hypothetical protein
MVTSGVTNQFCQHGLQIGLSIATYIILSSMLASGVSVQRTNLVIMSLLTSNTHGGITTYKDCSEMPTPRPRMPNISRAMFTKGWKMFEHIPCIVCDLP